VPLGFEQTGECRGDKFARDFLIQETRTRIAGHYVGIDERRLTLDSILLLSNSASCSMARHREQPSNQRGGCENDLDIRRDDLEEMMLKNLQAKVLVQKRSSTQSLNTAINSGQRSKL
jgi:hypothetical protein